jgi:omega-6 fatty acid desaturase (delta-12 desaturase)
MLEACHKNNPELQDVPTLTLASSLKSVNLALWDEDTKKLVSYRQAKQNLAAAEAAR